MQKLLLILLSICVFSNTQAQYHIKTTRVDSNIYIYTSYGDVGYYKNIDANAVVVVSGNEDFIFDTPWDDAQAEQLISWVRDSLKKTISGCIITHAHVDRIGSVAIFHKYNIPSYCYHRTITEAKKNKHSLPTHVIYTNDTTFKLGTVEFVAYYPGAGHTIDNIVLYIRDKQFLYGGCFIKSGFSKSIGNIADADIKAWPISLKNMQRQFSATGINMVIPGHGSWESEKAIETTLQLLSKLK